LLPEATAKGVLELEQGWKVSVSHRNSQLVTPADVGLVLVDTNATLTVKESGKPGKLCGVHDFASLGLRILIIPTGTVVPLGILIPILARVLRPR